MFAALTNDYTNIVGLVGVVAILMAYFLLNLNKIAAKSMTYLSFNLIGATLVLYSLWFHWNLSSVVIEFAWITISLIGMFRLWRRNMTQDNIFSIQEKKSKVE